MIIKNYLSENSKLRIITAILLVITLSSIFFYCPPIIFSCTVGIIMFIMLQELKRMVHNNIIFNLLAPWYPIIPCCILIYFNQIPECKILLYYLFTTVFSFDSGSYIVGKICNKFWKTSKIIPVISPGKSWEGLIGGCIISNATIAFILHIYHKSITWNIFLLNIIICIIAFAGDIFESYLKRSAQIKDSGTILPGHGGLLDRCDGILFVSYFLFIFKNQIVILIQ